MRRTLIAATVLGLAAIPGVARAQDNAMRTITVSGQGEVIAVPDIGNVSAGVETRALTAAEALKANSAAMSAVLAALKAAGIAERDVMTSGLSLSPVYDYNKARQGPPKPEGFQASNTVSVTFRDLSQAGAVIDSLVAAGANALGGINFSVSDADRKLDAARADAIADARRKAEIMATAAGAALGPVLQISEGGRGGPPQPMLRTMRMEAADAVPIATGEQTLSVSVSVTWILQ